MSVYKSSQCVATTAQGHRCKLRTARSQLCWVHLRKEKGLRVKKSGVHGLGLFATKKIKKNRVIDKYAGEKLSKAQIDSRYGSNDKRADYTLCNGKKCVDARYTNASAARFANSTRGTGKRKNAKLTHAFSLKSTQTIPAGREILTSYGRDYFK